MVRFELGGWKFSAHVPAPAGARTGLGLCLQRYLVGSYCYYVLGETVMPDAEYDGLAQTLLSGWDGFEHRHKHLVERADLEAGTLYRLRREDYPRIVVGAATEVIYEMGRKR